MSRKAIGFYANHATGERVRQDLLAAGFGQNDVHLYDGGDRPGLWYEIKQLFGFANDSDRSIYHEASRRGATAVMVDLDGQNASNESLAVQILERHQPLDLARQAEQWRTEGWTGLHRQAQATTGERTAGRENEVIPVVQEELQIGKRQVQKGGLRIHTHVIEKPVQEQVNLREEHVRVERTPVDRPISDTDRAFQERAVEVTASAEQAVVSKQARVVEEIKVSKDVEQKTQTVRDTVRRTDVDVEPIGAGQNAEFTDTFVREFAADQRYRGSEWTTVEPEARRSFESRYPNRKWDDVRDAVRSGYERASRKV